LDFEQRRVLYSRDYRRVLGHVRRNLGVPLNFANEAHRVTIGCALIRHLHGDGSLRWVSPPADRTYDAIE
jgi:hypothetical protein